MESIDMSTHDLIDASCDGQASVTLETATQIWYSVAKTLIENLAAKKGTKLPSLGLVSITQEGAPTFRPAQELLSQFKMKFETASGNPDNAGASIINFSQVGAHAGVSREIADKVYTKIVATLGRKLLGGRSILLSFHKVMELTFDAGVLRAEMLSTGASTPRYGVSRQRGGGGGGGQAIKISFPGENLFETANKTVAQGGGGGGRRAPTETDKTSANGAAAAVQRARYIYMLVYICMYIYVYVFCVSLSLSLFSINVVSLCVCLDV